MVPRRDKRRGYTFKNPFMGMEDLRGLSVHRNGGFTDIPPEVFVNSLHAQAYPEHGNAPVEIFYQGIYKLVVVGAHRAGRDDYSVGREFFKKGKARVCVPPDKRSRSQGLEKLHDVVCE